MSFTSKVNLNYHYRLHTRDLLHTCDVCSKNFLTDRALKNHSFTHMDGKVQDCESQDEKVLHRGRHYGLNDFRKLHTCDMCNKTFLQRCSLKLHYRLHTGEKPYKCDECDKIFSYREDLKYHCQVHMSKNT